MASIRRPKVGYGIDNSLQNLAPTPVVSNRDPGSNDVNYEYGQMWINKSTDSYFVLTSAGNWQGQDSGSGTFTDVTVTTGDLTVDLGNVIITAGDLSVGDDATVTGDLTVNGVTTLNGDIDISSAALIDLTSTLNAAPSIYLHANGGTSEQILLRADQGTAVDSVSLLSDVGGVTIAGGLATADAINLTAASGGIDVDAALLISLTSTRNNAQAVLVEATAGGIDILASGAAAGEDIDIIATGSSINIAATENSAGAITIGTNTYHVRSVESDTALTLYQGLVAIASGSTYTSQGKNCLLVRFRTPTSQRIVNYWYWAKDRPFINDSDEDWIAEIYSEVLISGAVNKDYLDKNDVARASLSKQVYEDNFKNMKVSEDNAMTGVRTLGYDFPPAARD